MCSITGTGSITGMCSMPMLYQANAFAKGDSKGAPKGVPKGVQKGIPKRIQRGFQKGDPFKILDPLFGFFFGSPFEFPFGLVIYENKFVLRILTFRRPKYLGDHSYITSSHFWDFWTPSSPMSACF